MALGLCSSLSGPPTNLPSLGVSRSLSFGTPSLSAPSNPGSLAFLTPQDAISSPSLSYTWGIIHTVVSGLPLSGGWQGFGHLQVERETKESTSHWSSFRVKQLEDNQAFHIVKSDCLLACPLCVMLLKNLALIFPLHHKMSPLVIPAWYVQGPGKVQGEKILLNNSIHGILLWVSSQLLQTSTLSHYPHLFHSVISQNFLCQVLSKVLGVQRQ